MVARIYALIPLLWLLCSTALAGDGRQQCLNCHPVHLVGKGSCTSCHGGNPSSERKNIAHYRLIAGKFARFTLEDDPVVNEGKRLIDQYACRRCHVSAGKGNRLATSLDSLPDMKTPEEISVAIKAPAMGMPDFRAPDRQVSPLVNGILWGAQRYGKQKEKVPLVIHFNEADRDRKDVFSRKCGPCHMAITQRLGVTGSGNIGPNLSGLLSEWYPHNFKGSEVWSEERLRRWLENPREARPAARMPPVGLSVVEFRELVDVLKVGRNKDKPD